MTESAITIFLEDIAVGATPGQTVGAALLRAGVRTLRWSRRLGEPRGLLCVMGTCYECQVTIDGRPGQRACLVPVRADMRVTREQSSPGQRR